MSLASYLTTFKQQLHRTESSLKMRNIQNIASNEIQPNNR